MAKTYIQKGTDAKKDLQWDFDITTKHIPDIQFEQKEVFKRDWADQQGDEEYLPVIPVFKAYEQDLEFVCAGVLTTAIAKIKTFLKYLQSTEFSLYDEYSQRGIRCRFVSYDNKAFYRVGKDVVVFTIKVKINNPLCYAIYTTGVLLTATANSATVVYWDDGTTNTYATNAAISKTFTTSVHFGMICPSKI